mmetsp:Transcript_81795/g.226618  ORF Transcript_81795/g.226618 Transcript_81795/m.226618 type:complete len:265 (+) Transcript_81795:718-1512(+)
MVEPAHPNHGLAHPVWVGELGLLDPGATELTAMVPGVLDKALDDEEHLVGHLALAEENLLGHERDLLGGVVADCAHGHRALLVVQIEKRMPREDGHVHLVVEVHLQGVWDLPEELHVAPHLAQSPGLRAVLQVPPDPHRQLHRDLIFTQVLPQDQLLSSLAAVALAEAGHCLGNAADESGEGDHCQDHDAHVVSSLTCVSREDFHRRRSELRERPMQTGHITVSGAVPVPKVVFDPCLTGIERPDPVPSASDEVVQANDEQDML